MIGRVSVQDLRKRYGNVLAVQEVGFEVQRGEIFGLLGPNGAGKTTTIECILGLRQPDGGTIHVCGLDARLQPREVKHRIGAALQTTALQDKITPREALHLFGSFYRTRLAPEALLDRFALADKADAAFHTLSGGQRQRLALALAFVNDPEVVLLDEPTTGLDPSARRELHAHIDQLKHEGHTVLLSTHYMAEAEQLCDRVAILGHGRILATGSPRELITQSNAMPLVCLETVQDMDSGMLAQLTDVRQLTCDGTSVRFRTRDITRTLAGLLNLLDARHVDITSLHVQKATLEDVFIDLTAECNPGPGSPAGEHEPQSPA